jgi:hypothetical protein
MESRTSCPLCLNLQLAFEARQREFIQASSLAYYLVSKKFAAYMNVEMERARIDLQDHMSVCTFTASEPERLPCLSEIGLRRQEVLHSSTLVTAA